MEELRKARSNAKRAFTRELNNIRQCIAEDMLDTSEHDIADRVDKLKSLFVNFTKAHDAYQDSLEDEADIDTSEEYYYKVQEEYISVLERRVKLLDEDLVKTDGVTGKRSSDGSDDISREELLSLLNLPKVELEVFNGDPLQYHQFVKAFDINVDNICTSGDFRLTRLMQYTSGPAKEAIRCCQLVGGDKGYVKARSILEDRLGNPHLVTDRLIRDLRCDKAVRSPREIQQLADKMQTATMVLSHLDTLKEVDSQSTILEIVGRLQTFVQIRWKKLALDKKRSSGVYPDFTDLVAFVNDVALEANDPVYGNLNPKGSGKSRDKSLSASASYNVSVSESEGALRVPNYKSGNLKGSQSQSSYARAEMPCVLCKRPHRLWHCNDFKRMTPKRRLDIVNRHKLCHNCLRSSHETAFCGKQSICHVKGCGKKHTMYIHVDGQSGNAETTPKVSNASISVDKNTYMPIVSVLVNDEKQTYALLDTASSNSFCSRQLAKQLGIRGRSEEYKLHTLCRSETENTECVNLCVSADNGEKLNMHNVYLVDNIPIVNAKLDVSGYDYLADIDLSCYSKNSNVQVGLLIGQDNAEALLPLEVRKGRKGEPFAVRTLFGWCLNGQTPGNRARRSVISHFVTTHSIENEISRLWRMENEDMEEMSWSEDDKSVIALWDSECRKVDNHYEIPIPWKDRDEPLPNNFVVAQSRLEPLVKKVARQGLANKYNSEIDQLLDKGYAEVVQDGELYGPQRVWYLPHHGVVTDRKPDKLRVVFDCASKFQGRSLNDRCKQGPDLINKLVCVLLRFREHPYAIQADIEAMYNQVRIPTKDRDALRFLWCVKGETICCRMASHLFGGVWCASSASYALRRTVADCEKVHPLIRDTIERSFYVDDCLKSVATKEEARVVIRNTPEVLSTGGFNLTKFIVNDKEILNEIPEMLQAKAVKDIGPDSASKALGIKWSIVSDEFYFEALVNVNHGITRRKMLSVVASMFDPLGLLGPIVLVGKLLFQEATRRKLAWDAPVAGDLATRWGNWIQSLTKVGKIRIPRCVKPEAFNDAMLELHHFSDASQRAYGCCSYLRSVNKDGMIKSELLMSKSKVAPLQQCTIPRLELQGAVLASKVDSLLKKTLDIKIDRTYFWVDSEVVLKYIRNDTRRFHVFVGNRISTIRQLTDPGDWGHIGGRENPADVLSRGCTVDQLDEERWLHGPAMLKKFKTEWVLRELDCPELSSDDPEVRKESCVSATVCMSSNTDAADADQGMSDSLVTVKNPVVQIADHYASWYRMKRSLAWWIRLITLLRKRDISRGNLSVEEIQKAELVLIKCVQGQYYQKELHKLSRMQAVLRSSPLKSLSPYMDQDGAMRVGGRLGRGNTENNHPCIIPKSHNIANAIIRDVHDGAHLGVEWVHSIVRKRYWIVGARPMIKRLVKSCVTCRKLYARPGVQLMADLPRERFTQGKPPFTYVGVDVFGPYYVKLNRSEVKRYGCLFTCLVLRAVHIEKLATLDTESFLNGLRRFMARRGVPEKVYSDNGTNFVAGEAELRRSVLQLSENEIKSYATRRNIQWHFNPPAAPHMGGVWERLIGCIKRVMKGVLPRSVRLTDEILETVFCEVEAIVNGRPLTKVSEDPGDLSPLTPNHLLLLREGLKLPPGKCHALDVYRSRWRHVQHLADQFWRQWVRTYLPELQRRHKWTEVCENLAVGDLVLILDENTSRNLWPLAVVTEVNRSRDGRVRSARVKTRVSELVRPVTKLVLLESVCNVDP